MKHSFDAIITGAGAAGLAAARELSGAGKSVALLEARQRIGGRIWTAHVPDLPLPIELGAEFIHGEAQETFAVVQAAALVAYQLPDDRWWSTRGKFSRSGDFWQAMSRLRARNFMLSADRFVPTWWTAAPVRAPLLTGWAGGHAADALLAEGAAIPDRALDSLASTFGKKRREVDAPLDSVHMHNWQADPFSRGAYSYAAVGGQNAHAALAKPVAGTLFFAGRRPVVMRPAQSQAQSLRENALPKRLLGNML